MKNTALSACIEPLEARIAPAFIAVLELSNLNGANGFQINGAANDESGNSVSDAGDVNGDGFADFIIGTRHAAAGGGYSIGVSYVVFGKAGGAPATFDLSTLDGSNGFKINGETIGDFAGRTVSGAGDVNGDGFADLLIGARRAGPNGLFSGAAYVVFGKTGNFTPTLDLSTLDGTNGFQINGEVPSDFAGFSVSDAGDVNNDGFADVVVSAAQADPGGKSAAGSSYVIFGKANGFSASLNLSSLDGSNGFKINGEAAGDYAGSSVSGAGDVNGDGFDDVLIGAFRADPSGPASGASYVVFGKAAAFSATLELSALDGTNGFRMNGAAAGDYSGGSVSGVGDVNGDGVDDIVIGAFAAGPNGKSAAGSSYVVFGKRGGFAASLNLSALNGSNGFAIYGEAAQDSSGSAVSGAGDINGDGFDDVVIGAFAADPNGTSSGSSYIIFGKAGGFSGSVDLTTLNGINGFKIHGEAMDDYAGTSVSKAGDINGDGFADLLIGAFGAGASTGASYIVFGHAGLSTFNVSDATVLEGDSGARQLSFTVSRTQPTTQTSTVDFSVLAGTATAGSDYTPPTPGTLTFAPGETTKTVSVDVIGDANVEGNETLSLVLSGATNAAIDDGTGVGTILDDDLHVTLHGKRQATFTDVDGDAVTIKSSKGPLRVEDFTLLSSGQGAQLALVDFRGETGFAGANLTIIAKVVRGTTGGDGFVNVGAINAAGLDLGKVKIDGDLGQIDAGDSTAPKPGLLSLKAGSLGALGIATQLPGGSVQSDIDGTLKTVKLGSVQDATLVASDDIGSVAIKGAVLGGSILSDGQIHALTIGGDLAASAAHAATISARGTVTPSSKSEAVAIGKVSIEGAVDHAQILAGYDHTLTATNPDVSIGKVSVRGAWSASSLVAGVVDTTSDGFGRNDARIPGGSADVIARIASITIKGAATGSPAAGDHFGITAEMIGKAKISGNVIALPGDDDNVLLDTANNDFRLREVRS